MGNKLARVVVILAAVLPAVSFALGLGPITMRSSLNQPLDAEIEVHSAQPGDLDGLAVRLASAEDFTRVNVERNSFLTRIRFELKTRADGSPYIKLTTTQPVTEPYLDFLIEARWPRGRALKEYTVLVDPPVLTADAPAPVEQTSTAPVFSQPQQQASVSEPVEERPVQERSLNRAVSEPRQVATQPVEEAPPSPPPVRHASPPPSATPQLTGTMNYGVVNRNDTLWDIALKMRPDDAISVHQMMLALLKQNPNAFYQGNVNRLKAGSVLRIEDASRITEVSKAEAIAQIRNQNNEWRDWKGGRTVRQTDLAAADEEAGGSAASSKRKASSRSASAADEGARLKLVTPGTEEDLGSGGASESKDNAKVRENLLLATEKLDANRQESEDLAVRMGELEEQLQSMQRLIMLKDEELLALQNSVDKPAEEQQETKPAPAKPKAQDKTVEAESGGLFSDPILIGLIVLVLALIIGWMVMRRRKMQEGFQESILNVGMASQAAAASGSFFGSGPASQPQSAMVSDFAVSGIDNIQSDATEVDPISEADVYLAYGRHQQAEDIIKQAIDKTPDRLELHSKLLEVYHAAKNARAFEAQAQVLHNKIGGNESSTHWIDIIPLGQELCPNSPLFGGVSAGLHSKVSGVSAEEEDLLDFDFEPNQAAQFAEAEHDEALDFDVSALDFDLEEENSIPNLESLDDNTIEFDMALDMDDGSSGEFSIESEQTHELELEDRADDTIEFNGINFAAPEGEKTIEMHKNTGASTLNFAQASEDEGASDLSLEFDQEDDSGYDEGADIVSLDSYGEDDIDLDGELDEDIFANVDEVGTKLDLAKAYVDMGDSDGARSILDEVLEEGDASQKQQAEELLQQMG